MAPVVAGIVFVFLLSSLNLLFTFGVIRRLREITEWPPGERLATDPNPTTPVGTVPGDFTTTTTDGQPLSLATLRGAGNTVVGFFSTDCPACTEAVAAFTAEVGRFGGGVDRVLAVVSALPEESRPLATRLEQVAQVVVEPIDGAVADAFKVTGVPAMCLLDADAVVLATGRSLEDLAEPASA